jgi:hypothetical protein
LTRFNPSRWLDEDFEDGKTSIDLQVEVEKKLDPSKAADYVITTVTGSKLGSGTDANVYLIIHGDKGETDKLHLTKQTGGDKLFEKGQTDVFNIKALNVGEIKKINISHDGKGMGAGWFVETIKIENLTTKKTFKYLSLLSKHLRLLYLNKLFIAISFKL